MTRGDAGRFTSPVIVLRLLGLIAMGSDILQAQVSRYDSTLESQRFPICREADRNANPNGGTREISCRLDTGEAGWLLQTDRVDER